MWWTWPSKEGGFCGKQSRIDRQTAPQNTVQDALLPTAAKSDLITRVAHRPQRQHAGPLENSTSNKELAAKFCVERQMVDIVLLRKASLSEYSDAFVQSQACIDMQIKIKGGSG